MWLARYVEMVIEEAFSVVVAYGGVFGWEIKAAKSVLIRRGKEAIIHILTLNFGIEVNNLFCAFLRVADISSLLADQAFQTDST